jgi:hypothetical protein
MAASRLGRLNRMARVNARSPKTAGNATELDRDETRTDVARVYPVRSDEITGSSVGDGNPDRVCIARIAARYGPMEVPVTRPWRKK